MKPIYVLTLRIAAPLKSVSEVHNCKVSFFFYVVHMFWKYHLNLEYKFRETKASHIQRLWLVCNKVIWVLSQFLCFFCFVCSFSILAKFDRRVLGGRNRFQLVFVPVSELLFASNQCYAAGMLILMYMLPAHRRWKHWLVVPSISFVLAEHGLTFITCYQKELFLFRLLASLYDNCLIIFPIFL